VPICIVTFDDLTHSSIERTTTESWSTRRESCSTAEVATAAKTTTEPSSTAAVASCPPGVSEGNRGDAD
jgi:hypothetical protein